MKLIAIVIFLVNVSIVDAMPEIHFHAKDGRIEKVKELLDNDPNLINSTTKSGDTPLHWAIRTGRKTVVNVLLDYGANVTAVNNYGNTCLHVAAESHRPELVELMLRKGADIHAKNKYGATPLHEAARTHSNEAIRILIKAGANINAKNNYGHTPMDKAVSSRRFYQKSLNQDNTRDDLKKGILLYDTTISILSHAEENNGLQAIAFRAGADDDSTGPWPQWRGPDGLGVSSERNLPEIWSSNSENIRWKTRIPGEGNSSPVVSNGCVILTTAYESPVAAMLQTFTVVVTSGLALVFLLGVVVRFFRKRRERAQKETPLAKRDLAGWFNTIFAGFTSLCFICFALLVTVGRGHSDLVFGKFRLILSRLGWTDMMHLCSMTEGVRAAVWLTSGGIALLGLAVCVGWLRAHSIWRLFGGVVVLLSAILLVAFTPLDQWKEEVELWEKLVFLFPGLVVGLWHLSNYFEIGYKQGFEPGRKGTSARPGRIDVALDKLSHLEFRWRHKNIWHFGSVWSLFFVLLLTSLSLLVFIPPNFFLPQTERVVVCVDMETGKMLWERPVFAAPPERKHTDNTYATPTAAADGRYIVVNFGVGVAYLDFEGRILWSEPDPDYIKTSRYGAASSPLLAGDKAIVVSQSEYRNKGLTWIAAFDKQTGRTCWKISPANVHECYTTPLVYRGNNKVQLIIPSFGNVSSFDIETGEYLWMTEIPTEQLVASMARAGTLLCVGGGTWGPKATIMMRLNSTDKGTSADILWQSEQDAPGDCSPVIYDGKLFTVTDTGKMTCYDAVDGTVFWNKRLKGGRYLSSLVAGDGKVYACNTKGLTTVIAADSEFKILAENDLGGRCYASAAIADGCILLRIADYLYCIEKSTNKLEFRR